MLGAGIGMASGAFLGGVLRDLTGDYTLALVCSFVLSLMGTLAILVLPSTAQRQIPGGNRRCHRKPAPTCLVQGGDPPRRR